MADATVESATGDENDDNWLYGDSNVPEKQIDVSEKSQEPTEPAGEEGEGEEKDQEDIEENNDDEHFAEVGRDEQDQANGDADSQENGDSDSDDSDDVKVTIGDIKSGPQAYGSLNIKRGVGLVASGAGDKNRTGTSAGGKVTLEDLDGPGSINGVPALEFNIDTIEDKPWNKPGADISDYFNYGFNEVTWSAYCERQRRMRVNEAGVGLHVGPPPRAPIPDLRRPPGPMRNDDTMPPMMPNNYQTRENTIQVMTAERREYGRSGHGRDLAAPPDYFGPPPTEHYYPPPPQHHSSVPYEEPWGHPEASGWAPTEIKELTPGPMGGMTMGPPPGLPPPPGALAPYTPPFRPHPPPHAERDRDRERDRERDRDRDRDRDRMRDREDRERRERDRRDDIPAYDERERDRERDRSRSIKPDRIREKSYRRERSRSRSRRHKSRSRSPRGRDRSRDRERSVKPKKDKDKDDDK